MHHATKKKLVAEYGELITSNLEEAKSQMAAAGLTEEDIEEIITAVISPSEATSTPAPKKGKEVEEVENGNLPFEKWQMSKGRNESNEIVLKKVEKIKDVSIRQEQADLLNDQSFNTLFQYFPSEV